MVEFYIEEKIRAIMTTAPVNQYQPDSAVHTPENATVVLVGGCFDILHYGHLQFLEHAKRQGDYLIVALEPDETISGEKRRKAIHTQDQRASNLSAIRFVDQVLLLPVLVGFEGYKTLCLDVKPNVLATTAGDPELANKTLQAEIVGAQIKVVIEHLNGLSSTSIQNNNPINIKNALRAHIE